MAKQSVQRNQATLRISVPRLYLAGLVVFVLVLSFLLDRVNFIVATVIFGATVVLAYKVIRQANPTGGHHTDISFWVSLFVSIDVLAIAILALFGLRYSEPQFLISRNIFLLSKTIFCYALFIGTFVLTATLTTVRKISEALRLKLYPFSLWLLIVVALTGLTLIMHLFTGVPLTAGWGEVYSMALYRNVPLIISQLWRVIAIMKNLALIFLIGTLVAQAKTLQRARWRLVVLLGIGLIILFALTTERGAILGIGLGAVAFADMVRWRNRFLSGKLILIAIILLLIANSATWVIEAYIRGIRAIQLPNLSEWPLSRFFAFHPQPIYVGGTVISWVDDGLVSKLYGASYIEAIKGLLPSQFWGSRMITLDRWFIMRFNPIAAERGAGMGFSPIAEGYLNFGMPGVALEGFLLGVIAGFIRWIRYARHLRLTRILLYAGAMPIAIGFYRFHLGYVVDKLFLTIIATLCLRIFAYMFVRIASSASKTKYKL